MPVYTESRALAVQVHRVVRGLTRADMKAGDQLIRAVLSIMLNIAEGAGEFRPLEKARFYRMARRSCFEAAAVFDHLGSVKAISAEDLRDHLATLERLAGSLSALCRAMEGRPSGASASDPRPQPPRRSTRNRDADLLPP
jgi:four helix bundle protein